MNSSARMALALFLILAVSTACVKQPKAPTIPGSTTPSEQMGDVQFQAGNFEKALELYNQALDEGGAPDSVLYRKGFAHFARDEWEMALESFQASIQANPKLAIAHEGAGLAAFQLEQLDRAGKHFEDTRQLTPNHWVPYAFLAAIAQIKGFPQEAQALGDKAVELGGEAQRPLVVATMRDAYNRAAQMRPSVKQGQESEIIMHHSPEEQDAAPQFGADAGILASATPRPADEPRPMSAAPEPGPSPEPAYTPEPSPAPEPAPASEPAAMPEPSPVPEPAPAPEPAAMQESSPAPEPAPAPAVRPAPKAEPAPPPVPQPIGGYAILESSWKSEDQAKSRMSVLKNKGLAVYTAHVNLGSRGIWYRVLFGPFKSLGDARNAKDRLAEQHNLNDLLILQNR